jgi:tRNA 2-thiocytidine biosynthesis protein TtcA
MFSAMQDIRPSHMLDKKLYDFVGLKTTGVENPDGDKAFDPEVFKEALPSIAIGQKMISISTESSIGACS